MQDVIELNGKRYDAITGAYLGKSQVIPQYIIDRHVHGKVIDGFVRPSRPVAAHHHQLPKHTAAPAQAAPKPAPAPVAAKPKAAEHHTQSAKAAHALAAHVQAHHPQKAKTLVRRATKKPEFSLKPAIKTQAPAEVMARPESALMHKRSAYSIDPVRKERAGQVGRHQAVRHFHPAGRPPAIHSVAAEVPVIDVRPAPIQLVQPAHKARHHNDIFEAAMARATSHEQPAHKVRRHHNRRQRLANTMAIIGTFLIIGGFITYFNLPQLQLRVASFEAGFGASMPGYAPTGYALNDVKRTGGTISLSFRSGENHYTITQQSSDWNSQTLLDNTLALNGQHQTVQKNGQTIYVYEGNTSASWVNAGVRYDISGNTELSPDDIVSIADSL